MSVCAGAVDVPDVRVSVSTTVNESVTASVFVVSDVEVTIWVAVVGTTDVLTIVVVT